MEVMLDTNALAAWADADHALLRVLPKDRLWHLPADEDSKRNDRNHQGCHIVDGASRQHDDSPGDGPVAAAVTPRTNAFS